MLKGETRGYTHHPQLIRFRESVSPLESIAFYLHEIYAEALRRDYHFDAAKIGSFGNVEKIPVTHGQLDYEWMHLKAKLKVRDPAVYDKVVHLSNPEAHPLFHVVPGPVAEWEVIKASINDDENVTKEVCSNGQSSIKIGD